MDIRVISFDVWSTLVKSNPAYKQNRATLLGKALGINDFTAVTAAMNIADDDLDDRTVRTGEQFGFEDRVNHTAKRLFVEPLATDGLAMLQLRLEMDQAFLADLPTLTEPDLIDTLRVLHGLGYTLAVNSNTGFVSGALMREMLDKLGILPWVQITLFSDEIGVAKPNPEVFKRLVRDSQFDSNQILHVGDNYNTDYTGAIRAGLQALHYQPSDASKLAQAAGLTQLSLLAPHPLLTK